MNYDGSGVMLFSSSGKPENEAARKAKHFAASLSERTSDESRNCGTGKGGFQPGNKCALGSDGIPDVHDLEHDSNLGGSTGAALMRDSKGRKFVVKSGNSPEHVESEYLADSLYAAMGAAVPAARMSSRDGEPAKVAEYVAGKPLAHLSGEAKQAAYAKLREHFVADALLANWDVIGMGQDNIIVDGKGTPYRIDNGGSLKFRAQGAPKTYGPEVGEIDTLRSSNQGKPVFGSITDDEISKQVADIVKRRDSILHAAASNPEIQSTLSKRIDYLARKYGRADETRTLAALERARLALRNCGTGKGGFQPGNTCAKGGDGEESPPAASDGGKEAIIDDGKVLGEKEAFDAYVRIFANMEKPSSILREAGWTGGTDISVDDPVQIAIEDDSLNEDQKMNLAGSIAGVAFSIRQNPSLADLEIRISRLETEVKRRVAALEVNALKQGVSGDDLEKERQKLIDGVERTAGYYESQDDVVTLVAGADSSGQEKMYLSGWFSAASPLHTGVHECAHAMHYRAIREAAGLPRSGSLAFPQDKAMREFMAANMKEVFKNPPAFLKDQSAPERIRDEISGYAGTNPRETAAEYYSGVVLGGIDRRDDIDEYMKAIHAPIPAPPATTSSKTRELRKNRQAAIDAYNKQNEDVER